MLAMLCPHLWIPGDGPSTRTFHPAGYYATRCVPIPSLSSSEIEAAHITAIITHEFPRVDHWKLDLHYRDKEPAFAFNSTTGQFESFNSVQSAERSVTSRM